ncbi:hypothetical protein [Streptomyces sp. WAC04114]|uniref:hypothetical protein n=1 Tax=Streptomyces sp. WAC04114 TaxID=2867961 RepID=UPI001C8CA6FB|nr:hypothetical protein [Streptomyces sp. WAC04114]MBX9363206.1 hypothetical protein [Streptomyces sp. WAC04114]
MSLGSFVDGVPARESWPAGIWEKLERFVQGHVVAAPTFSFYGSVQEPLNSVSAAFAASGQFKGEMVMQVPEGQAPQWAIITTATCDIAEPGVKKPKKPFVQVAPVVNLERMDRGQQGHVRRNRVGHFVYLPALAASQSDLWVADLRYDQPVEKSWLAGQEPVEVFDNEAQRDQFGKALAWVRDRPAMGQVFIDHVQRPLQLAFQRLFAENKELGVRIDEEVSEWAVQADSRLDPHRLAIFVISGGGVSGECREWWQVAVDGLREQAAMAGLTITGPVFADLSTYPAAEYLQLTVLGRLHSDLSNS